MQHRGQYEILLPRSAGGYVDVVIPALFERRRGQHFEVTGLQRVGQVLQLTPPGLGFRIACQRVPQGLLGRRHGASDNDPDHQPPPVEPRKRRCRKRRAGFQPARRARERERFRSVGVADGGRQDACPTLRFMESLLSLLRMHWDHEPRGGGRRRASVLDCGSPLPLLRPRTRSESARGLAHSKTWRYGGRFMERALSRSMRSAALIQFGLALYAIFSVSLSAPSSALAQEARLVNANVQSRAVASGLATGFRSLVKNQVETVWIGY